MSGTITETDYFHIDSYQRKRKAVVNETPPFLTKTFHVINICPNEIGGWSEQGTTFLIKDVERFSSEIIPTEFKHNKFSSFVRQLHSYGFRKLKVPTHGQNWLEFYHPLFRRGARHSLSQIKRSAHLADENLCVKQKYDDVMSKLTRLDDQVSKLTHTVGRILSGRAVDEKVVGSDPKPTKRRKRETVVQDEFTVESQPDSFSCSSEDSTFFSELFSDVDVGSDRVESPLFFEVADSGGDLATDRPAAMEAQLLLETKCAVDAAALDAMPLQDLTHALQALPQGMQERFVDKLAHVVGALIADDVCTRVSPHPEPSVDPHFRAPSTPGHPLAPPLGFAACVCACPALEGESTLQGIPLSHVADPVNNSSGVEMTAMKPQAIGFLLMQPFQFPGPDASEPLGTSGGRQEAGVSMGRYYSHVVLATPPPAFAPPRPFTMSLSASAATRFPSTGSTSIDGEGRGKFGSLGAWAAGGFASVCGDDVVAPNLLGMMWPSPSLSPGPLKWCC